MDRVAELRGERVVLRPMEPDDAPRLREILATPEVARWWGAEPEGFPVEDDPGATRFALLVDGDVAGLVQWAEEEEPDYRHAWIDLFLEPSLHGQGLGTDAVATPPRRGPGPRARGPPPPPPPGPAGPPRDHDRPGGGHPRPHPVLREGRLPAR